MANNNYIPVDASRYGTFRFDGCAPKTEFNSNEQKRNKNGVPIYEVNFLVRTGKASGSEKVKVQIASNSDPAAGIELDAPVKVEGLCVSFGTLESGRLWSKFSADKIAPAK